MLGACCHLSEKPSNVNKEVSTFLGEFGTGSRPSRLGFVLSDCPQGDSGTEEGWGQRSDLILLSSSFSNVPYPWGE